jgi:hypothetical protein
MTMVDCSVWSARALFIHARQRLMAVIDPLRPIAWAGDDRLLLNDCTPHGLRRKVIARKSDWLANAEEWIKGAEKEAGKAVDTIAFERDDFFFLWIFWKEKRK